MTLVFCSELRVFQRNTLSLGKSLHEKVALISSRLKFLTKFEVGSDQPIPLKMSKIKLAFWSPPQLSLISLDSNIASVKVSREVCSIFVQVLLQESCREASSRLVMKRLASCTVPCVGSVGKPAVPGKGGW